jgi:hypothetical protein
VELRLRESQGVDVALESLSYEIADPRTSESWGGETLDANALRSRFSAAEVVVFAPALDSGGACSAP